MTKYSNKLFLYPVYNPSKHANPYTKDFELALRKHFDTTISPLTSRLPASLQLLWQTINKDIFVLNWIEDVTFLRGGTVQAVIVFIAFIVIRLRMKKMVWVFHNIQSHHGKNRWTDRIRNYLFDHASLIITHSMEAKEYAYRQAKCPVLYKPHPVRKVHYGKWNGQVNQCDFFIWGSIQPYKGVVEFLRMAQNKFPDKQILVIGKCTDALLEADIQRFCSNSIVFKNRYADFNEIAAQCKAAKYVLFPYVGDSISSSGVLIDTIQMGGIPVGPDRGAFRDLSDEGCCITYHEIDEVIELLSKTKSITQENVKKYMESNSWNAFGEWFKDIMFNSLTLEL